ncbi:caspase family protein [Pseudooceanicola sp. C21-150M6]|uniref:caspase family protein n=1 Tax=Pseudooceanicola sp. C21-150M6 TaxID=3434355 RepID=UPI003D7FA546
MVRFFLIFFLCLAAPVSAANGKKVALVIGNSDYADVPVLNNPRNDARDIAAALKRLDFDVSVGFDLNHQALRLALRDFSSTSVDAEIALIYFAGHGIEVNNVNYVIPTNARLRRGRDVEFEAVPLQSLVTAIEDQGGVRIVLVDACRNNPFAARMESGTRSIGRGLARVDPGGTLVGYSARGGTLALDGEGRNSPYAKALLEQLEVPGLEIGKMFRLIRDRVVELTDGAQEPFTYGSLPGRDIFLAAAPPPGPTGAPGTGGVTGSDDLDRAPLPPAEKDDLIGDFAVADKRDTVWNWEKFLEKHGERQFNQLVVVAQRRLDDLLKQTAARRLPDRPWIAPDLETSVSESDLTRDQRMLVQEALNMMGHDVGAIDGAFGPQTRRAISSARIQFGMTSGAGVDHTFLRNLVNVPAIKALQSDKARRYTNVALPPNMEPRLERVINGMRTRDIIFGYFGGHLYVVVKKYTSSSWRTNQTEAQSVGGHLVTITSAAENRFVYDLFRQDERLTRREGQYIYGPMIGLYQIPDSAEPSGGWAWVTGEPMTYNGWARGNPDNHKGRQHFGRFYTNTTHGVSAPIKWDDTSERWDIGFIMEVD